MFAQRPSKSLISQHKYLDINFVEDDLPQPYKFLNKLAHQIIDLSLEICVARHIERLGVKVFQIPKSVPSVTAPLGDVLKNVVSYALSGSFIYVGKEDGELEVYNVTCTDAPLHRVSLFENSPIRHISCAETGQATVIACSTPSLVDGVRICAHHVPSISMLSLREDDPREEDSLRANSVQSREESVGELFAPIAAFKPSVDYFPINNLKISEDGRHVACASVAAGKVALFCLSDVDPQKTEDSVTTEWHSFPVPTVRSTINKPVISGLGSLKETKPAKDKKEAPKNNAIAEIEELPSVVRMAPLEGCEPIPELHFASGEKVSRLFFAVDAPIVESLWSPLDLLNALKASETGPTMTNRRSASLRVNHTLIIGWRSNPYFTTVPLQRGMKPMSTVALPSESIPLVPINAKDKRPGAKDDPKSKKSISQVPEVTAPFDQEADFYQNHVLPSCLTSTASIATSDGSLLGLGCADGVVIIWDCALAGPKYIFSEFPGRLLGDSNSSLLCSAVSFHKLSYCVAALTKNNKQNGSSIVVYDLSKGVSSGYVRYTNRVTAMKCLLLSPFFVAHFHMDERVIVFDIMSAQPLCCINFDSPTGRVLKMGVRLPLRPSDNPALTDHLPTEPQVVKPQGGGQKKKQEAIPLEESPKEIVAPQIPTVIDGDALFEWGLDFLHIEEDRLTISPLLEFASIPYVFQAKEEVKEVEKAAKGKPSGKKDDKRKTSEVAKETAPAENQLSFLPQCTKKTVSIRHLSMVEDIVRVVYPLIYDVKGHSRDKLSVHKLLAATEPAKRTCAEDLNPAVVGNAALASLLKPVKDTKAGTYSTSGKLPKGKKMSQDERMLKSVGFSAAAPYPPPSPPASLRVRTAKVDSLKYGSALSHMAKIDSILDEHKEKRWERQNRMMQTL